MVVGTATPALMRVVEGHPQRSLNTVTTNVPGPQFPLYCLGRRMTEHLPFVPIGPGLRVGTAILSYDGQLAFGVTGDFDSAPDVEIVADWDRRGIGEFVEFSDRTRLWSGAFGPVDQPRGVVGWEMKALQLTEWQHDAELREVDQPDPGPGQVLVRIGGPGRATRTCT